MHNDLPQRIVDLVAERGRAVVAISGFGGSGKTTLASQLRDRFGLHEDQVVRLDSFIVNRGVGEGMLDGFNWASFESVLRVARAGEPLRYRRNDYDGNPHGPLVEAEPATVVIVEGVLLLRPGLDELFDLRVWIDCPQEVAMRRGYERDLALGASEADLALWEREWGPKERAHFEHHRPDLSADVLIA